jgi:hypothetical protein
MTSSRFQLAAITLIAFNIVGTVMIWTMHLSKPGTSNAYAILNGTEFTGPIFFIVAWAVFEQCRCQ